MPRASASCSGVAAKFQGRSKPRTFPKRDGYTDGYAARAVGDALGAVGFEENLAHAAQLCQLSTESLAQNLPQKIFVGRLRGEQLVDLCVDQAIFDSCVCSGEYQGSVHI